MADRRYVADGGDARDDDALVEAAKRLSLRAIEEENDLVGFGCARTTNADSNSPRAVRPLRRRARWDVSRQVGSSNVLRRRQTMAGIDELALSAGFSRLGVSSAQQGGKSQPHASATAPDMQEEKISAPSEPSTGSALVGGDLSVPASARSGAATSSRGVTRASQRRVAFADMSDILAENQHVDCEMKRRSFQSLHGQWVGGVLLEGDPQDDAELEGFLRNQFRAQQAGSSASAWGSGRTLGRS